MPILKNTILIPAFINSIVFASIPENPSGSKARAIYRAEAPAREEKAIREAYSIRQDLKNRLEQEQLREEESKNQLRLKEEAAEVERAETYANSIGGKIETAATHISEKYFPAANSRGELIKLAAALASSAVIAHHSDVPMKDIIIASKTAISWMAVAGLKRYIDYAEKMSGKTHEEFWELNKQGDNSMITHIGKVIFKQVYEDIEEKISSSFN